MPRRVVLASASAGRKTLLGWLQIPFEIQLSEVDEDTIVADDLEELVMARAIAKAEAVVNRLDDDALVIAADTMVVLEGEVFGKPKDQEQAYEYIEAMQGERHAVVSAVCVVDSLTEERYLHVDTSYVHLMEMNDQQIVRYIETGDWQGKAGGYEILGAIAQYVQEIDGSVTTVIGLPLAQTIEALNQLGMDVQIDLRQVLMHEAGYGR